LKLPQCFKYSTKQVSDALMGVAFMLPASFGAISTEKIVRNDVLKPISLALQNKKSEIQIDEAAEIASVIEDNIKVLDAIRIPDHFSRETLREFFEKTIREDLEKDPLHKKSVRIDKYAKDFRHYMRQYFEEIFDFHEVLKKDRLSYVQAASDIYLRSDFPPSFARTVTLSLLSECRFVDIYNKRISQEYVKFLTSLNDETKFRRHCDAHNLWVGPIDTLASELDKTRIGLVWYVEFTQSKKVEDIFKPKPIKKSLLDQEYFFVMLLDLQRKTEQFRRTLVNLGRDAFFVTPSREDSTVSMFSGILEAIGS